MLRSGNVNEGEESVNQKLLYTAAGRINYYNHFYKHYVIASWLKASPGYVCIYQCMIYALQYIYMQKNAWKRRFTKQSS